MAGEENDESEQRNRGLFSPGGGTPEPTSRPSPEGPEGAKARGDVARPAEPTPYPEDEQFPAHGDDPYRNDGPRARSSIFEHPALPWMAVAVAVLVVLVVIVAGRGDDSGGGGAKAADPVAQAPSGPTDEVKQSKDCLDFSYGANLLGEPRIASEPGVHLWQDIDGFHLRLIKGAGSVDAVSGTIGWSGEDLALDPNDPAGATVADGKITFTLAEDAQEVNFRASCKTESMTFDLKSNGTPLDPAVITVGRGDEKISANPVTLTRGG